MIEINLLPEELRVGIQKANIESAQFFFIAQWVVGVFIFIHIFLAAIWGINIARFNILHYKWTNLEPQRKILATLKATSTALSADAQLTSRVISWSEKLNRLSFDLPSGIWFNEVSLSAKDLVLKGSVLSLQKEEMVLINQFINNLKLDTNFFKDFSKVELNSMQTKVIGGYEILDFILTFTLKGK